ncbi:type IV secretion system protein, partial [Ancylobacter sonchi]|uniref:type IV secretion system protein n=1 Tax=Ancylobacter sonchi TaxID=1937790 RepID=UPI001BD4AA91
IPFGLFGKTAFMAERVLGNVVSSGIKVMVLAVIIGIGSTLFGQFTAGFGGQTPTIDDAMAIVLAALSLLGLGIFGPGIAASLVSGGPQLSAGAAVGTGLAAGGALMAAGGAASLAVRGGGAALSATAAAARGGATAYSIGAGGQSGMASVASGLGSVARAAGSAAVTPLANAVNGTASASAAGDVPDWAKHMKRGQSLRHGVSAAAHAVHSGDSHAGGSSVSLSESDRS